MTPGCLLLFWGCEPGRRVWEYVRPARGGELSSWVEEALVVSQYGQNALAYGLALKNYRLLTEAEEALWRVAGLEPP